MSRNPATSIAAALWLVASLVLQSCAARATASPTPVPAAPSPASAPTVVAASPLSELSSIAGTQWSLAEIDGKPVAASDRRPTLSLEGARAAGFAGCNRWGAEVTASGPGTWKLGPIAATRMACEEAEMKLEQRFLAALGTSTRWKVEGRRLLLSGDDGKTRLAFSGPSPR